MERSNPAKKKRLQAIRDEVIFIIQEVRKAQTERKQNVLAFQEFVEEDKRALNPAARIISFLTPPEIMEVVGKPGTRFRDFLDVPHREFWKTANRFFLKGEKRQAVYENALEKQKHPLNYLHLTSCVWRVSDILSQGSNVLLSDEEMDNAIYDANFYLAEDVFETPTKYQIVVKYNEYDRSITLRNFKDDYELKECQLALKGHFKVVEKSLTGPVLLITIRDGREFVKLFYILMENGMTMIYKRKEKSTFDYIKSQFYH